MAKEAADKLKEVVEKEAETAAAAAVKANDNKND